VSHVICLYTVSNKKDTLFTFAITWPHVGVLVTLVS